MKSLTCEMCGSTDVIKKDGVYVCQYCDTKYTVEEAKKMMIEGTVDVTGSTVKMDHSDAIDNYISLAQIALDGNDSEGVIKYAEKILELDSKCCDAYILMAKSAGMESSLKNPKLDKALAYAKKAASLAEDKEKAAIEIYSAMKAQIYLLFKNALEIKDCTPYVASVMSEWINVIASLPNLPISTIEAEYKEIKRLSTNKKMLPATNSFSDRLPILVTSSSVLHNNHTPFHISLRNALPKDILNKCSFTNDTDDTNNETESGSSSSGGCYVATCVYGSYDCPQVWTLRRYRDDTLASTWYGRAFIRTYYAVSPTLVKWFGNTDWFKRMWKGKLDKMVRELNESGIADTPYNDR